jgi:hypothetical protein
MSNQHDVISAFLDDEAFDANELGEALSKPAGRDLLLDLLALRHMVQPEGKEVMALSAGKPARSTLRPMLAAAAVVVAVAGGYLLGQRRGDVTSPEVPAATRIVEAAGTWQDVPRGSL